MESPIARQDFESRFRLRRRSRGRLNHEGDGDAVVAVEVAGRPVEPTRPPTSPDAELRAAETGRPQGRALHDLSGRALGRRGRKQRARPSIPAVERDDVGLEVRREHSRENPVPDVIVDSRGVYRFFVGEEEVREVAPPEVVGGPKTVDLTRADDLPSETDVPLAQRKIHETPQHVNAVAGRIHSVAAQL